MTSRTSTFRVPFALCAFGLLAIAPTGCRKAERQTSRPQQPVSSVAERYAKDPTFRAALAESENERGELSEVAVRLMKEMKAKFEAKKRELQTADDAKVKAALAGDPEWVSLRSRCKDALQAVRESRDRAQQVVRVHMAPTAQEKEISK